MTDGSSFHYPLEAAWGLFLLILLWRWLAPSSFAYLIVRPLEPIGRAIDRLEDWFERRWRFPLRRLLKGIKARKPEAVKLWSRSLRGISFVAWVRLVVVVYFVVVLWICLRVPWAIRGRGLRLFLQHGWLRDPPSPMAVVDSSAVILYLIAA